MGRGPRGASVGEGEIEGRVNGCAYTDNKPASVRGCEGVTPARLCYLHSTTVNWQSSNEKMSKCGGGRRKKRVCSLLTPSLKEPFTCVDTLE